MIVPVGDLPHTRSICWLGMLHDPSHGFPPPPPHPGVTSRPDSIPRTGSKHANKAAGPLKWLTTNLAGGDGFGDNPFYEPKAHAVDLPVSIHQGVSQEALENGTTGVIQYFLKELYVKWMKPAELVVVAYDRAELVPCIKGLEQGGRTEKIGKCDRAFDPLCAVPLPSSQFQAWLRAHGKAARDGIAEYLCFCGLSDDLWKGRDGRDAILAFYGVEGNPPSVQDASGYLVEPLSGERGGRDGVSGDDDLLHFRNGASVDTSVKRQRGPNIGEAELSVVHFIVWSEKYWGKTFDKWLVTSVDTDQWMIILLAMSAGKITPHGVGEVQVTVQRIVGGQTKFLLVNQAYKKICILQDGSDSAWPADGWVGWNPSDDDKVRLFVLVYLLAGCDFLPAISGLPFEKMWEAALKSVRAQGVFNKPLFVKENGVWALDEIEVVKLLTTMFYFKHEPAFRIGGKSPAEMLTDVEGNVESYVNAIRVIILRRRAAKTVSTCPGFKSMLLQVQRAGQVMGYWQDGLQETMPSRNYDGKGWGFNPKEKWNDGERLTAENCVLWLSEYSYIGPDRKTVTIKCGCAPEKARKHRCITCSCKTRECSLVCGCRGSCRLDVLDIGSAATDGAAACEDVDMTGEGGEATGDGGIDKLGDDGDSDSEIGIDVEGGSVDGVPDWVDRDMAEADEDESDEDDDDELFGGDRDDDGYGDGDISGFANDTLG